MKVYVFIDKDGQILGICDKKHLKEFLSTYPYGIHDNETNHIIIYILNDSNDRGEFYDFWANE